tara:strand:+ start:219 stop:935 length:717 start_codon:yes stop_codon:yes gene_type:complete
MSDKLNLIGKTWKFDDKVSKNFDQHVNQSIPHYADLQKYLVQLSEWFLKENSIVYDLGCSTGETISQILKLKITSKFTIIGIDNSKKMLNLAKKKISEMDNKNIKIKFINSNLEKKIKLKKSNLIYSILLFPFIPFDKKNKLLRNIFLNLNDGGALICVEKIRSKDSLFEDILNQLYFDFKLSKKLSEKEIMQKAKSLRSSMYLCDEKTTFKNLKFAGFKKTEIFFKCFNFIGYIAIK